MTYMRHTFFMFIKTTLLDFMPSFCSHEMIYRDKDLMIFFFQVHNKLKRNKKIYKIKYTHTIRFLKNPYNYRKKNVFYPIVCCCERIVTSQGHNSMDNRSLKKKPCHANCILLFFFSHLF